METLFHFVCQVVLYMMMQMQRTFTSPSRYIIKTAVAFILYHGWQCWWGADESMYHRLWALFYVISYALYRQNLEEKHLSRQSYSAVHTNFFSRLSTSPGEGGGLQILKCIETLAPSLVHLTFTSTPCCMLPCPLMCAQIVKFHTHVLQLSWRGMGGEVRAWRITKVHFVYFGMV